MKTPTTVADALRPFYEWADRNRSAVSPEPMDELIRLARIACDQYGAATRAPAQTHAQISELDDASNACLELAAKHSLATGHGDTVGDMIREFSAQIRTGAPAQGPTDCGDDEDRMVKISALIARLQSTKDQFGDTCVYIRRGGLSWGAVALNRRDDDQKHGVFDLQAQHDRDMLERLGQVERLKKDRDEWRQKVWDAEVKASSVSSTDRATPAPLEACAKCQNTGWCYGQGWCQNSGVALSSTDKSGAA